MRRELLLIGEMIEAASQAQSLVAGIDLATLSADRQRREALLWNFTVLGEAAAQLDDLVKAKFPKIPWVQPVRLRNRVIHGYWSIDLQILHTTATDLLPGFCEQLRDALEALDAEEGPSAANDVVADHPEEG
ncbi:MAG: DUF86 domain-containing protein [Actinomycetota bacterium]|nr:DUF86 domain-containing protein [Actinomycetota bacterium]